MSTRAIIQVMRGDDPLVTLYHHHDGYPEYLGRKLRDFCGEHLEKSSADDTAVRIVTHLKGDPKVYGNLYMESNNYEPGDHGEEYLYRITEGVVEAWSMSLGDGALTSVEIPEGSFVDAYGEGR